MTRVLLLAWRYVAYYRVKTLLLTAALTLTIVLPLTAHLLIQHYGQALTERADDTPLVAGAKGNRFDLVLKALYFGDATVDPIPMSEVDAIHDSGHALAIPLHLEFTARDYPIVGTTPDYFDFRGLAPARGTPPLRLGQCVLGSRVAADLDLDVGDAIFSDQRSLYDISKTYPLKMHIVGVLAPGDPADNRAVFTDVKTAWLIAGLFHGHQDMRQKDANDPLVLARDANNVVANAAILEYQEVTANNLYTFHLHGEPGNSPLSAVIVVPHSAKSRTILKARYDVGSQQYRMLDAREVVDDLMGLVFRIKRFFDANFALVLAAAGIFLALVVLLSQRLRQREMETMVKLGCRRLTTVWMQTAELLIVVLLSLGLSAGIAVAILLAAPQVLRLG